MQASVDLRCPWLDAGGRALRIEQTMFRKGGDTEARRGLEVLPHGTMEQ